MRIDTNTISDPDIRAFLSLLKREGLNEIIVLGGAVRDILLSRPTQDIDIAVRLTTQAPKRLRELSTGKCHFMIPALTGVLHPLAEVLGCKVDAFYKPLPFGSLTIDVLGLVPVQDCTGYRYPDIFIDNRNNVFGARPELSINRIALNSKGKIWPDSYINDLYRGIARFSKAPLWICLRQVIRALNACRELGLRLTAKSAQMLHTHLHLLRDRNRFFEEIQEKETLVLMQNLYNGNKARLENSDHLRIINHLEKLLSHILHNSNIRTSKPSAKHD